MRLKKAEIKATLARRLKTTLRPFQRRGVYFFERHGGRAVCADDPGLGKSVQSVAFASLHAEERPVCVVCPATLKYNWRNEWMKHAGVKVYVCDGEMSTPEEDRLALRKRIAKLRRTAKRKGWTLAALGKKVRGARKNMRAKMRRCAKKRREVRAARVLIVNYDILESWLPTLVSLGVKILVVDECHYVKNPRAKRTKACRYLAREVDRVLALSGTPIDGRPVEFWPVLNMVRPDQFPSFWKYAMEYCGPKKNRWSGGWDFNGRSHLDALRRKLKGVMIRRRKSQVLKQLPAKQRVVLPVDIDNRPEYEEAEEAFLAWLRKKKGKAAWDRARRAEAIVRMNGLKLLAAQGKLNAAVRWIKDWLEGTDEKLVVFAINHVVLDRLKKEFPDACTIDGRVSNAPRWVVRGGKRVQTSKRQEQVEKFEGDPKRRIILCQMDSAGVGINLVSANNVLKLQPDWSPSKEEQTEDRTHRIGQTRRVTVYHMVGEGTIEERILEINQEKSETSSTILDGKRGGAVRLLNLFAAVARRKKKGA